MQSACLSFLVLLENGYAAILIEANFNNNFLQNFQNSCKQWANISVLSLLGKSEDKNLSIDFVIQVDTVNLSKDLEVYKHCSSSRCVVSIIH